MSANIVNTAVGMIKPVGGHVCFQLPDLSVVPGLIDSITAGQMRAAGVSTLPDQFFQPTMLSHPGAIRFNVSSAGHIALLESALNARALPKTREGTLSLRNHDLPTFMAFMGALGAMGAELGIEGLPQIESGQAVRPTYYGPNPPDGGDYYRDVHTALIARFNEGDTTVEIKAKSILGWMRDMKRFILGISDIPANDAAWKTGQKRKLSVEELQALYAQAKRSLPHYRTNLSIRAFLTNDSIKYSDEGHTILEAALLTVIGRLTSNEHGLSLEIDPEITAVLADEGRVYPDLDALPINKDGFLELTGPFLTGLND